jgi:3-hydroxyacyl-[acyl-carrier-protein] dehydratase
MESIWESREILEMLPHRFPFLLVDRVLSVEYSQDSTTRVGNKIVALKNVSFNEPFFPGHFPGLPVMPGVLQIEAMAQAACLAFLRKSDPPMDFFVAAINNVKFRKMVVPGDTLMLHGEIVKDRGSILIVNTQAKVQDTLVAEAEIMAKVSPRSQR